MSFKFKVGTDGNKIPMVYLNTSNIKKYKADVTGKVKIQSKYYYINTCVTVDDSLHDEMIRLNDPASDWINALEYDNIDVSFSETSDFHISLEKMRRNEELSTEDVERIMRCIRHNNFNVQEIIEFLNIINEKDLTTKEISLIAENFSDNCNKITFDKETYGFHSLGGVPGNKITPIVVSIVASAGVMIPKMSTHAITGACGTVDSTEIYCDTCSDTTEQKKICERTNGFFVCSDSLYITEYNTDLLLIETERYLGINPRSLMLASIMAVEKASGVKNLLMDFPMWHNTKIKNEAMAKSYEKQFVEIGKQVGVNVKCVVTDARQPVGFAVGPALEAIESIRILEGKEKASSAADKACRCAGAILEMAGMEDGVKLAREILDSGKALEKFREIVAAQGGDGNITSDDISVGAFSVDTVAHVNGKVTAIDNTGIVDIAKTAGAPVDKKAGLILHRKIGDTVKIGDKLMTIYSDTKSGMENAFGKYVKENPFTIE